MPYCEYDGVDLTVGENWTENRKTRGHYVCRQCASKIAQGKLGRKDRRFPKQSRDGLPMALPEFKPSRSAVYVIDRHNRETVGDYRAQVIADRQARIARQMTPEVLRQLALPFDDINTIVELSRGLADE